MGEAEGLGMNAPSSVGTTMSVQPSGWEKLDAFAPRFFGATARLDSGGLQFKRGRFASTLVEMRRIVAGEGPAGRRAQTKSRCNKQERVWRRGRG